MARFQNGWVKIYRAAILGDIGSNFNRLGIFTALVAIANLRESTVNWMGNPRKLGRGELVTSLRELADLGEVDVKTVSRHLNYLAARQTIKLEKSATGTFIKINNFEEYQSQDAEGSTLAPRDGEHDVHATGNAVGIHIEERKNKRKKEEKNSAFDFAKIWDEYKKFGGVIKGSSAQKRFDAQIKDENDWLDLQLALTNYQKHLKVESWRKPKQSLEAFLGTKSSGFFWREWIEVAESNESAGGMVDLSDIFGREA